MSILLRNGLNIKLLSPKEFAKELELQLLLADCPDLLRDRSGTGEKGERCPDVVFVDREVYLREAGKLDLLFVDDTGMPICVEVKLGCNDEVRRTVVAQAIDYLSVLTSLTAYELDVAVSGKLENALWKLAKDNEEEFDRLWEVVETNLYKRKGRVVVVADDAPPSLERIFHFLAESSDLDIRLFTVQQYQTDVGEILVSQSRRRSTSRAGIAQIARIPASAGTRIRRCL
jgi:hypothetical protein